MFLHTSSIGSGSNQVVFLHGLMGRGKNFTGTATALANSCTSLLVDAPNHGESDWAETFSYAQMADATANVLREKFSSPVDVVGHSMGGKTAMLLALRHPELVRQLVVVDVSPTSSDGASEFRHLIGSLLKLELSTISSRRDADVQLKEAIPEDGVRSFLLQNLERTESGFTWQPNIRLLFDSLDTVVDFPAGVTESFENPTLWVRGENSNYITESHFDEMNRLFPDTVPVTIHGAGHWVHADRPQEFQALLEEFLTV